MCSRPLASSRVRAAAASASGASSRSGSPRLSAAWTRFRAGGIAPSNVSARTLRMHERLRSPPPEGKRLVVRNVVVVDGHCPEVEDLEEFSGKGLHRVVG